jgi:hypothetical protein
MLFRFELMDYISIRLQFSLNHKLMRALLFLMCSAVLFAYLLYVGALSMLSALMISIPGFLMLVVNVITRRQKGKRQYILAQIILVSFIAYTGAMVYHMMSGMFDHHFYVFLLFNALYFSNSVIYVRSKTVGAPYDVFALLMSVASVILVSFLSANGFVQQNLFVVYIPMLIKTLDNVILVNIKVPMRRIGLNETFHGILYTLLFYLIYTF